MSLLVPIGLLAAAACVAFVVRKRLDVVAVLSLVAVLLAFAIMGGLPAGQPDTVLGLTFELTALARLAAMLLLATLALLLLYVWLAEPAYNFFPTALGVGAACLATLLVREPLAIYVALLVALLIPVGTFTFHIHANRSVEAAIRHFGFVTLGGSLGLAALALAAGLPREHPEETFILLIVIVFAAFALKLAAIPFHTHAALLAGEAPAPALALYFGVIVPVTFIAFSRILFLSGLLPAIVEIGKVQQLALGVGIASAVGGAFLASGAPDLRRLVVYSVISGLGMALVGIGTFSGPGSVGGIAIALATGASATQPL
ncbi:MAG TPA: proton-conducting transporter membrane subunit, partial [Candidatus Limnocylindrales bacterium]|nr:proton-conducting transporter membrane subunit [Candidatus Limnocylindrales bacterium]